MKPTISVIIPTYNSAPLLLRCLQALEDSNFSHYKFEILVIDDGSTDDTRDRVQAFALQTTINVRYFWEANRGPGPARNIGMNNAQGDIIAFTDADCVVDPNWLSVIYRSIAEEGKKLIGGHTYTNDTLIFPWIIAPAGHTRITANLAIDRTALSDVRFDEHFLGLLGQDIDFANRIEDRGHPYTTVPDMRVLHPANVLGLRRVIYRIHSKANEVQLYKRYGQRVITTMHPLFRPWLLGRFSVATIGFFAALVVAGVLGASGHWLLLAGGIALACLAFIGYCYRFCVTNAEEPRLTLAQRLKTLAYLVIYVPLFLVARIEGSIKYKFVLL